MLSLNAGLISPIRRETADGLELTFAANYLGHFFLTNLLLSNLKAAAPSRINIVSGGPGVISRLRLNFDDLQAKRSYHWGKAALHAALAKVMFTMELDRRLEGSRISVNTFHPGLVKSHLGRDFAFPLKILHGLSKLFMGESCKTGAYLATSPEVESFSGRFFVRSQPVRFNFKNHGPEDLIKLWKMSENLSDLNVNLSELS